MRFNVKTILIKTDATTNKKNNVKLYFISNDIRGNLISGIKE